MLCPSRSAAYRPRARAPLQDPAQGSRGCSRDWLKKWIAQPRFVPDNQSKTVRKVLFEVIPFTAVQAPAVSEDDQSAVLGSVQLALQLGPVGSTQTLLRGRVGCSRGSASASAFPRLVRRRITLTIVPASAISVKIIATAKTVVSSFQPKFGEKTHCLSTGSHPQERCCHSYARYTAPPTTPSESNPRSQVCGIKMGIMECAKCAPNNRI